ncbi:glycosyltransferase [Sulfurimonas sp.]|uniref:glycosyltransferase n=1 Tax=Sulfurimonas sp. TaxID=2022749 RepID=UPI002AB28607|nr:glycosyltransferase [Sulfurimonas sp.]
MKNIILFTQNLETGGIQKVVSNLANYLYKDYSIFIVLSENDKKVAYHLNNGITIKMIKTIKVDVSKPSTASFLLEYRVKKLNKIIDKIKPILIFSFGEYSNIISLKTSYKCKKIVSQRAVFESMKAKKIHLFSFDEYKDMMIKYYPLADKIICVSNYISNEISDLDAKLKPKLQTVYNGVDKVEKYYKKISEKYILNIGRLHPQKGQLDIILAFEKIADKIEHNLIIIGEGELREVLENKILELNLSKRVHLLGEVRLPYDYLHECELFVFASYYEGFPNILLEAMSANTAVISYKFEGYNEILDEKGTNLCKINDVACLSKNILNILKDKNKKVTLAKKMFEISKKFTLKKSLDKYKKIIIQSIGS